MTTRKVRPGGHANAPQRLTDSIVQQRAEDTVRALERVQSMLSEFRSMANRLLDNPRRELIALREEFTEIIGTQLTDDFQSAFDHFKTKHFIAYFYWQGLDAARAAHHAIEEGNWPHAFLMIDSANMLLRGMIDAPYRETLLKQRKFQPFAKMPGHNRGRLKPKTLLYRALKSEFPRKGPKTLAKFIADNSGGQRSDIAASFLARTERTSAGEYGTVLVDIETGLTTTVELLTEQIKKALRRAVANSDG